MGPYFIVILFGSEGKFVCQNGRIVASAPVSAGRKEVTIDSNESFFFPTSAALNAALSYCHINDVAPEISSVILPTGLSVVEAATVDTSGKATASPPYPSTDCAASAAARSLARTTAAVAVTPS